MIAIILLQRPSIPPPRLFGQKNARHVTPCQVRMFGSLFGLCSGYVRAHVRAHARVPQVPTSRDSDAAGFSAPELDASELFRDGSASAPFGFLDCKTPRSYLPTPSLTFFLLPRNSLLGNTLAILFARCSPHFLPLSSRCPPLVLIPPNSKRPRRTPPAHKLPRSFSCFPVFLFFVIPFLFSAQPAGQLKNMLVP